MSHPFGITGRLRSVRCALQGIGHMLRSQHNAKIHAAATVVTVCLGLGLGLSAGEWCWIVLAITSVWAAEAMNTAFEFLCDVTTKDFHPIVGQAKDVAAGAVLLAATGAAVIGLIVFVPKVLALVEQT